MLAHTLLSPCRKNENWNDKCSLKCKQAENLLTQHTTEQHLSFVTTAKIQSAIYLFNINSLLCMMLRQGMLERLHKPSSNSNVALGHQTPDEIKQLQTVNTLLMLVIACQLHVSSMFNSPFYRSMQSFKEQCTTLISHVHFKRTSLSIWLNKNRFSKDINDTYNEIQYTNQGVIHSNCAEVK